MKLNKQIALIIAMLLLPLAASADDSGSCGDNGDNVTYTYVEATQTLTISGTGAMNHYDSWSPKAPWNSYKSSIQTVIIEDGVTSIGSNAFYGCIVLSSVTIPNSVTSIEANAFYGCTGLSSVTIPNSVTSIGYKAFYDCLSLTSITIPNSVTSIGDYAFYNTTWYNSQSDGLLYLDNWLLGMKKIRPNGDIVIKDGTKGIAGGVFYGCSYLTSVTIPNTMISIGEGAFGECSGLTSVTIPNSVTRIESGAFVYCSGLTSVSIPNSVTSIEESAFQGCSGLTEVHSQIAHPFAISYVFSGIPVDATLYVPAGTKETYKNTDGWNVFKNIVEEAPVSVTGLALNKAKISLRIGSSAKMIATVLPENATNKDVTWSTSDKNVATVSADGTVKGIKEGTAIITCASVEKPTITAKCSVTVKESSMEGDLNDDGEVDVTDVVELIDMVLAGSTDPSGDINGDGEVDVTDVVELIDMVLSGE